VHINRLLFHHIGLACRREGLTHGTERRNLDFLGYCPEGEEWVDDRLGMRGQFMIAEGAGAPRLELVAPHGEQSPVTPWLERGIKLYHLAYLATDLSAEIELMRERRAKLMLPPTPAVAFGNRHVAFVMLPNLLLIELIEKD
jgi:methylmalonyl-CoA/ethylmalonyl-CoA epimerase